MLKRRFSFLTLWLLLAALVCPIPAVAEGAAARHADWFAPVLYAEGSRMHLLSSAQLETLAQLPSKECHAMVEAMFLAAAGVKESEELKLWKSLRKGAEREARSAENAAYRALTLPWLKLAFMPGNRPAEWNEAAALPAPTAAPSTDTADETPPEEPPAWQPEDGYAALQANAYGQAYLTLLAAYGGSDASTCMAVTQAIVQRWLAELDHAALAQTNGHYQLWLYAPDTPIDYPVVKCGNNSYYLERMFNRKRNPAGTIFIDYRNLADFRDPNTLIYGHHMRDSSMFHSLTDYDAPGFYEAHPVMLAISDSAIDVIEVFAGYLTDSRDRCYDIAISDEQDMAQFVGQAKEKSDFTSHVEIDCGKDHLVTMSTCAYNFDNARYVVLGRLCRIWESDADKTNQ